MVKPLRPPKSVPRTHLLHPDRVYVKADDTNIAATFARVRAEQAAKRASAFCKVRAA